MNFIDLLRIKLDSRNETWEEQFLALVPGSVVNIDKEAPSTEFDGWPYLHVSTAETKGEPFSKVVEWLSERGIGLVLNSHKSEPDYVFSYGMLWSYRSRGKFIGDLVSKQDGKVEIEKSKYEAFGAPTESAIPNYVRKVLRQFFMDQGILAPKVLVVSEDGKNFELIFSTESLGYPPEKEHQGILEALSWFFPPDYSIVLARETGLPEFSVL
jgi:hypothetical protein